MIYMYFKILYQIHDLKQILALVESGIHFEWCHGSTLYIYFRPISDIDLPELPDFLRPDPSTPRPIRPIQDIDLPDGASVIQPDEEAEIIENKPFKEEEGKKHFEKNFFVRFQL